MKIIQENQGISGEKKEEQSFQNSRPQDDDGEVFDIDIPSESFIPKVTDFRTEKKKVMLAFADGTCQNANWVPQGKPLNHTVAHFQAQTS